MIDFQQFALKAPPRAMRVYLNSLVRCEPDVDLDRRRSKRFPFSSPVPIVPVDENLEPIGEPCLCVGRNISKHGVAFVHTRAVQGPRLVVELHQHSETKIQLLVEVLHCRPLGRYFEIGCRFVRRLSDDLPASTEVGEMAEEISTDSIGEKSVDALAGAETAAEETTVEETATAVAGSTVESAS